VTAVDFSDDGRLLATSSRDHDARVWDTATGKSTVLHGHFGAVLDASFSPDGRWVVTAGPTSAGLWDATTGERVAFLVGDTDQLTSASFSPDGSRILTSSRDGTARTYSCAICGTFDELVSAAAARLAAISGPLTPAQRARFFPAAGS
jgi:WD40 repeat protein